MKKISIVTPSYNQARFLEQAILSVWRQEGDFEIEHIVADGGSTDGSLEILKRYERIYLEGDFDFKCRAFSFKWWSEEDSGQSNAINRGFALSTGEILGWLNSDDIYLDSKSILSLTEPFQSNDADVVVGNGHHIDKESKILIIPCLINKLDNAKLQQRLETLTSYNFILQPATLFRRAVWESCRIDERFHYTMDWIFWIEAYNRGFSFYKINRFAAANRLHEDAKTVEGGVEKYMEGLALFRRYDVWSFNRLYYYLYIVLIKAGQISCLRPYVSKLISLAKKIRNVLVNRLKLY